MAFFKEYLSCEADDSSYFKDPNILFFISSNEKIQFSDKYHTFCLNDGGAIDDLYGLSICDYIVGPPSTFSQFASFLGQKPLLILWEKKQKIRSCEKRRYF